MEDIKKQIKDLEEQIRLRKLEIREERLRLKLLQQEERKASWGSGAHTSHPKGSDHHLAKSWDVWELTNKETKEYKYMGRFGSIGEIARAISKDYYTVWQMKNRWEKIQSGILEGTRQGRKMQYRIEEVA